MATYEEIGEYLNNPVTSKLVLDITKIFCGECIGDEIICSTCNKDFAIANVLIENEKNSTQIKVDKLKFKDWIDIKDNKDYFGSDNIIFKMKHEERIIGEIKLTPTSTYDILPRTMEFKYNKILADEWFDYKKIVKTLEFNEPNYKMVCDIIEENYENFMIYMSRLGYRTESYTNYSI